MSILLIHNQEIVEKEIAHEQDVFFDSVELEKNKVFITNLRILFYIDINLHCILKHSIMYTIIKIIIK